MDTTGLPDFVVIGAAKAGTTSLRRYLDQHPGVFMADHGEPSFFAHEGETLNYRGPGDDEWQFVTDLGAYRELFRPAPPGAVRGEISPRYLYFPRASQRLHHYVPRARIVAILRHPVDRAYSHFLMNRARGCEPETDFEAALAMEAGRTVRGWGWDWRYVSLGLYQQQLMRYYAAFPREQIRNYLYDDWKTGSLFADLFGFLGVDDTFRPDTSVRERVAALPRSYRLARVLDRGGVMTALGRRVMPGDTAQRIKSHIVTRNAVTPPVLADADRGHLYQRYFAGDCAALEDLIQRDLSSWR